MFFLQKKGAPDARQELLERARRERELRAASAVHGPVAFKLQALFRGHRCRQKVSSTNASELAAKLQQVAMLTAALKSTKGIEFIPPATVLSGLVAQATLVLKISKDPMSCAPALRQLIAWLQLHFRRAEAPASLAASASGVGQVSRLIFTMCRRLLSCPDAGQLDAQAQFLEFALFCVNAAHGERPELRAAGVLWLETLQVRTRFIEMVCRPLCTPPTAVDAERPYAPNDSQRRLCARAVELAVHLANCPAPTGGASRRTGGTAAAVPLPPSHARVLLEVFSIPYIAVSVAGSAAHATLVEPRVMHAMISAYSSSPAPASDPPAGFSSGGLQFRHRGGHSTGFRSGGGSGSTAGIEASPFRGSSGGGVGTAASSAMEDAESSRGPVQWSGGAYLLGNIVQLLCDPPPSSAAAAGCGAPLAAAAALEALDPRCVCPP